MEGVRCSRSSTASTSSGRGGVVRTSARGQRRLPVPPRDDPQYLTLRIGAGQVALGSGTAPAPYGQHSRPATGHAVDMCVSACRILAPWSDSLHTRLQCPRPTCRGVNGSRTSRTRGHDASGHPGRGLSFSPRTNSPSGALREPRVLRLVRRKMVQSRPASAIGAGTTVSSRVQPEARRRDPTVSSNSNSD